MDDGSLWETAGIRTKRGERKLSKDFMESSAPTFHENKGLNRAAAALGRASQPIKASFLRSISESGRELSTRLVHELLDRENYFFFFSLHSYAFDFHAQIFGIPTSYFLVIHSNHDDLTTTI